jgi:hypothetical protein
MIEPLLLLIQATTTVALAAVIIKLRRELYPMIAAAGPTHAGFWLRSVDVLVVEAPQIRASKTVIRVRWLLSEELFLIHRLRVYDVAMHPLSRKYYEKWKAWLSGDDRYKCREKKPRGLSKIYNKAIEVTCFKKEERPKEVIILPSRARRRGKRIIKVY